MSEEPLTRAERWVRSATADPAHEAAEREAREDARWEKLYRQLHFLPLTFLLWHLAIAAVLFACYLAFQVFVVHG